MNVVKLLWRKLHCYYCWKLDFIWRCSCWDVFLSHQWQVHFTCQISNKVQYSVYWRCKFLVFLSRFSLHCTKELENLHFKYFSGYLLMDSVTCLPYLHPQHDVLDEPSVEKRKGRWVQICHKQFFMEMNCATWIRLQIYTSLASNLTRDLALYF